MQSKTPPDPERCKHLDLPGPIIVEIAAWRRCNLALGAEIPRLNDLRRAVQVHFLEHAGRHARVREQDELLDSTALG